MEFSQWFSLS
uniref:Uncharacterized protein n=1 Tax=Anguilla anguilla TaxID=7936 RepID=A0A0E9UMG0_ANGAN